MGREKGDIASERFQKKFLMRLVRVLVSATASPVFAEPRLPVIATNKETAGATSGI